MPIILGPDPPLTPPAGFTGPTTTAADRLYARLAPLATYDAENGQVVQALAAVLTMHQQLIDDVARDGATQPAWGVAADPDTAPAAILPWLARLAGVELQPGDTEAQQRARIKAAAGLYRGTTRAQIEELQLHLTGTRTVYFVRYDPDLWHQTIGTLASESTATAATLDAAVKAQKPAGVLVNRVTVTDPALLMLEADVAAHRATIDGVDTYVPDATYATISDLEAAFATIALLEA